MAGSFEAVKISENVFWVGAMDWGLRDFHGYATTRGSSYNAYLVLGEKIALIDTVKSSFKDELLARISSVINPQEIDYIISNHSEMDHSGCLLQVMKEVSPDKVFASPMGMKALSEHFHSIDGLTPVKDGEKIDLGNRTLSIMETRMLHWPDSMFAFLEEDGVLFSQDAFGMHLASSELFADQIVPYIAEYEAAKYYANIVMPFSMIVQKTMKRVGELGWQIKTIAPDHGPIWRRELDKILGFYEQWAVMKPTMKTVVIYDTMWNSTATMSRAVTDGLIAGGSQVKLMPLSGNHRSDVATEILEAGALLVGTPTLNKTLFPSLADVLTYLRSLRPTNLIGAAFGSHGWSGEGTGMAEQMLKDMKVDIVREPLRVKYVPTETDLTDCRALGLEIAGRLKELVE